MSLSENFSNLICRWTEVEYHNRNLTELVAIEAGTLPIIDQKYWVNQRTKIGPTKGRND